MLQSSSQLSLLSEVRCSHLPPISHAGRAIGPSGERVGERDGSLTGCCGTDTARRRIPSWETPTPAQGRRRRRAVRFGMLSTEGVSAEGVTSRRNGSHGDAVLQQKGADLIDDADALSHQPGAYAMQGQSSRSAVWVATNFIVGRCTASAITSGSRKSASVGNHARAQSASDSGDARRHRPPCRCTAARSKAALRSVRVTNSVAARLRRADRGRRRGRNTRRY
jgi:hypothetical protein